jgi:hypothetical protein
LVMIASDRQFFDRAMGKPIGKRLELGTSEKALALVMWGSGTEIEGAEIRLALTRIDAED